MMPSTIFDETVSTERLRAEITLPEKGGKPTVLALHGAGKAVRGRTGYLANFLASIGKGSIRFDFSGHGESSGKMDESSLDRRLKEALAMARHLGPGPVTLTGNSMGGHTVVRLLEHLPVGRIILFCPAAYSRAAEKVSSFGPAFTEELRKPESWQDSSVWPILEKYTGKAMFVIGALDDVIPDGVVARYLSSLRNCSMLEYMKIPGAPHLIHPWLEQNAGPREVLFERLRRFMAD